MNESESKCAGCGGKVTPSKEAHFHRYLNGEEEVYHADCWQEEYADQPTQSKPESGSDRRKAKEHCDKAYKMLEPKFSQEDKTLSKEEFYQIADALNFARNALNQQGPTACSHGVRWPHECRDCEHELQQRLTDQQPKESRFNVTVSHKGLEFQTETEIEAEEIKEALDAREGVLISSLQKKALIEFLEGWLDDNEENEHSECGWTAYEFMNLKEILQALDKD